MRIADLANKRVVIWGTGREGTAAAHFIRRLLPDLPLVFVDESPLAAAMQPPVAHSRIESGANIATMLDNADVIIKSPGVSLYHPLIQKAKAGSVHVTSLLSLWFAENKAVKTIGITGTKGKSTTSALIAHMLQKLGHSCTLAGNSGIPVTTIAADNEFAVIEISSYQAADFDGHCDIGLVTNLYPEHIDWHKSLDTYFRDKLRVLQQAHVRIGNAAMLNQMQHYSALTDISVFNAPETLHVEGADIFDGRHLLGSTGNAHLRRAHNLVNLCAALTVIKQLGMDMSAALQAAVDFEGLPHRQHELGIKNGVLYVDDSISTTPQSAIAAMECYHGKPVSLIVGGYDRGIDYTPLATYLAEHAACNVICIGDSGKRIAASLKQHMNISLHMADGMREAVKLAEQHTPAGGVVLLSPAAPSFGMFKDYIERGHAFAAAYGFTSGEFS